MSKESENLHNSSPIKLLHQLVRNLQIKVHHIFTCYKDFLLCHSQTNKLYWELNGPRSACCLSEKAIKKINYDFGLVGFI